MDEIRQLKIALLELARSWRIEAELAQDVGSDNIAWFLRLHSKELLAIVAPNDDEDASA